MHSFSPFSLLQPCRQVIQNIQAPQVIFNLISRGSTWLQGCCLESLSLPDKGAQHEILSSYCFLEHELSSLVQHKAKGKLGAGLKLSHFSNYRTLVSLLLLEKCQSPARFSSSSPSLAEQRECKWGPASRSGHCRMRSIHTSEGTKQSCFAGCLDFFDSKGIYGYLIRRNCLIHFEFYSDGRNVKLPLFLRGRGEQYYVYLLC